MNIFVLLSCRFLPWVKARAISARGNQCQISNLNNSEEDDFVRRWDWRSELGTVHRSEPGTVPSSYVGISGSTGRGSDMTTGGSQVGVWVTERRP